jgi:hypothetical protein
MTKEQLLSIFYTPRFGNINYIYQQIAWHSWFKLIGFPFHIFEYFLQNMRSSSVSVISHAPAASQSIFQDALDDGHMKPRG